MSYIESFRVGLSVADAKAAVRVLAPRQTVLLAGPPGVGKTELVRQAAAEAGLELRTLMAPQLAPEDILGLPRLTPEGRTQFCPPETLVPSASDGRPVAIFLDELPSAPHDTQRALHGLLLDRTIGEHRLPAGSWVVAAGNRVGDGALARSMSTAVINRLVVLDVEPSIEEWLTHAESIGVRREIRSYLALFPWALRRDSQDEGRPMSTPRSWVALSRELDAADASSLRPHVKRAIVAGTVSAEDAGAISSLHEHSSDRSVPHPEALLASPSALPEEGLERWLALEALRARVERTGVDPKTRDRLALLAETLRPEERAAFAAGLLEHAANLPSALFHQLSQEAIG